MFKQILLLKLVLMHLDLNIIDVLVFLSQDLAHDKGKLALNYLLEKAVFWLHEVHDDTDFPETSAAFDNLVDFGVF